VLPSLTFSVRGLLRRMVGVSTRLWHRMLRTFVSLYAWRFSLSSERLAKYRMATPARLTHTLAPRSQPALNHHVTIQSWLLAD